MDISAQPLTGNAYAIEYDVLPSLCPVCHHYIEVTSIRFGIVKTSSWFELITRCPRPDCQHAIIAQYKIIGTNPASSRAKFAFVKAVPVTAKPAIIDEGVKSISPPFEKIYNQALTAESTGLDEVAGIGLRKALEFLIKDYCIHKAPANAEAIKRKFLGKIIKEDIVDQNIKQCAERAVWLGNDETHYVRTWTSLDINDLKRLINLTINYIANELMAGEYLKKMQP